jgi:hypothetical protein
MKFIIYNPKTYLFDFFLNSLLISLNELNIDMLIYNNNDFFNNDNIDYQKDIIIIIINPHFIFDYSEIKNNILSIKNKFKYKILYITEPINFIIEKKIYEDIIKMINPFALWTYTNENLNKLNIKIRIFRVFPLYNVAYNFVNIEKSLLKERNNENIIFFGNITDNRKNICSMFGNNLINKTESWTEEQWKEILNNNLFYLNIHRRIRCKSIELFRIVPILANGGIIFSESVNKTEEDEFKDYNIIFAERENLFNVFTNYKNNINYEEIYDKTLAYRNNMLKKDGLGYFMEYYKSL